MHRKLALEREHPRFTRAVQFPRWYPALQQNTMHSFNTHDLHEHSDDLVRNAEVGEYSVVSKHGKPLFVAVPFTGVLLEAGVHVALADQMVLRGELSFAAGAKMARKPYAHYLQHLSAQGYSVLDDAVDGLDADLTTLEILRGGAA
jgi:antitoxin (DNA-binding transcriptional repressor) of toxin-antitoxin stability system